MEKIAATAVVHTLNAGEYLDEVLDLLSDFAEVMVVDMHSTDDTLAIAGRHGCRVEMHEPTGYVEPARGFAMRAASHDWIFFVDADELVPPALSDYIRDFLSDPGGAKALGIPRKNLYLDGWSAGSWPDYQWRLLNRRHCEWPPEIHSHPRIDGERAVISRKRKDLALVHKPPTMHSVLERTNRYTDKEVLRRRGRQHPGLVSMMVEPWWVFVKRYILKGGWRQGVAGYVQARNDAYYKFMTLAKLYESGIGNWESGIGG